MLNFLFSRFETNYWYFKHDQKNPTENGDENENPFIFENGNQSGFFVMFTQNLNHTRAVTGWTSTRETNSHKD